MSACCFAGVTVNKLAALLLSTPCCCHRSFPMYCKQAAPEPKPLPLHVQVAAREVMTGAVKVS